MPLSQLQQEENTASIVRLQEKVQALKEKMDGSRGIEARVAELEKYAKSSEMRMGIGAIAILIITAFYFPSLVAIAERILMK